MILIGFHAFLLSLLWLLGFPLRLLHQVPRPYYLYLSQYHFSAHHPSSSFLPYHPSPPCHSFLLFFSVSCCPATVIFLMKLFLVCLCHHCHYRCHYYNGSVVLRKLAQQHFLLEEPHLRCRRWYLNHLNVHQPWF